MEKIIKSNEKGNNNQNKMSADDYRFKMVCEFLDDWYAKHDRYSMHGEEFRAFEMETDDKLESFLKNKGVKGRICSITKNKYYGLDNNAYPFTGRCSNYANIMYVVPARMSGVTPELIKNFGGNKKFAEYMDECRGYKNRA